MPKFIDNIRQFAKTHIKAHGFSWQADQASKDRQLINLCYNKSSTRDQLEKLLQEGACPNAVRGDHQTVLMIAAANIHSDSAVKLLVENGADVNAVVVARDAKYHTTLGRSPLSCSLDNSNSSIPGLLLRLGANMHCKDKNEKSIYMHAASRARSGDIISDFIKFGLDVKAQDCQGYTSLHYAARFQECPDVIRLLITAGSDLSAKDKSGATPLMIAAHFNWNADIAHNLVDYASDVSARDYSGNTALMHLCLGCVGDRQSIQIASILLDHEASPCVQNSDGVTPLIAAIDNLKFELASFIISQKICDINESDWRGNSAISYLATKRYGSKLLPDLIAHGVDLNSTNCLGLPPLSLAAIYGRAEYIECLLDNGIDAGIRDKEGKTALDYAVQNEALQDTETLERLRATTKRPSAD